MRGEMKRLMKEVCDMGRRGTVAEITTHGKGIAGWVYRKERNCPRILKRQIWKVGRKQQRAK